MLEASKLWLNLGNVVIQRTRPSLKLTMPEVVSFMSNDASPPGPKQLAFFMNTTQKELELSHEKLNTLSFNDVTISTMEGRS